MAEDATRTGAVSLVTGSARGLGRAVAEQLAARGDRVHVVWRSDPEQGAELEQRFPGRVHRIDLLERAGAARLVAEVLERDGRLDHVLHAVGDFEQGRLDATDADRLRALFASNVETGWRLVDAGREPVRAAGGSWLFFGCAGLAGLRARRTTAQYGAVKSALVVLARSLALEEAAFGVRANLVSPGIVPHEHAHPETRDPALEARIPLGRAGRPADVARAAAWLTSEGAAYVTGQDLEVAGGWQL